MNLNRIIVIVVGIILFIIALIGYMMMAGML